MSSYDSDRSAASNPHSHAMAGSSPSRQSGMVQPVLQEEMNATMHAAGSSLFGAHLAIPYIHAPASARTPPARDPVTVTGVAARDYLLPLTQDSWHRQRHDKGVNTHVGKKAPPKSALDVVYEDDNATSGGVVGLEGLCTVQQRPSSRGAPTLAVHPVQQGVNKWLTPLAEGGNKVVLPPG
eukprot:scaffold23118_cov140-Isochrysis_galbana.AAC.1